MFPLFKAFRSQSNIPYTYDTVQILGERDVQAECLFVTSSGQSLFAVIADGIKDSKTGLGNAKLAIEVLKDMYRSGLHKTIPAGNPVDSIFGQAVEKINKTIESHAMRQNYRPSVTAVIIEAGVLHVAEMHDSIHGGGVYICKNGQLRIVRKTKSIAKAVVSNIKLKGNESILLASDGAAASLSETEIINCLSDGPHINKCLKLRNLILQKSLKDQANATLITMELAR